MYKEVFQVVKDLVNEYMDDDGFTKGAALAYYTTFSIAPIILIIVAVAGLFLERLLSRAKFSANYPVF